MTFWIVAHTFKEGKAAGFFEWIATLKPEDWTAVHEKNFKNNMWNHSFTPSTNGQNCFCCWESKDDLSAEEFQAFIDGPDGPGAGEVFINDCHKAMSEFPAPFPSKFAS